MTIKEKTDKIVENAEKIKALKSRFRGKLGKQTLGLLEEVCYFNKSTYVPGDRDATHINEGTRRVILKIHEFLNMSDEEIDRRTEDKLKAIKK